jgi:hypothetical protein
MIDTLKTMKKLLEDTNYTFYKDYQALQHALQQRYTDAGVPADSFAEIEYKLYDRIFCAIEEAQDDLLLRLAEELGVSCCAYDEMLEEIEDA